MIKFSGPSRQVVAEGVGLSKLVGLLGDQECADVHVLAVEVLSLCLGNANSMTVLQGSGCLHQLLSHITESANQLMKKHAITTLATAATNSKYKVDCCRTNLSLYFIFLALNRKILHENNVENTFVQLLSKEVGLHTLYIIYMA